MVLEQFIETNLRKIISSDYTNIITNFIIEDVKEDLRICADIDYNEDDIKLAVGRVLIDKMNIGV